MIEVSLANPDMKELESIFSSIETATKTISKLVKKASLSGLTGLTEGATKNIMGDEQKKLDVITNDVLKNALRYTGRMGVLASEEEDVPVEVEDDIAERYNNEVLVEQTSGKYIAVFDPLDGSSNVDANIPTGTIFGIFEDTQHECDVADGAEKCLQATLQPGRNLVGAGYVLYSAATQLFMTLGKGTYGFTLDEEVGEFILSNPNVKIPARGKPIYAFNEANDKGWDQPLQDYVSKLKAGAGETGKQYTCRWIGSMVGDVHRTLLYGGIFAYPANPKNKNGLLRLLYEAMPMSFLVEQAGGLATTGRTRILDIQPEMVHQRVPVILGSADDVKEAVKYYDAT